MPGPIPAATFEELNLRLLALPEASSDLVSFWLSNKHGVCLEQIWSEVERGKGHASRFAKAAMAICDELGVDLNLTVHPLAYDIESMEHHGESEDEIDLRDALNKQSLDGVQLAEWYRRLGFERVADCTDDEPCFFRTARPSYVPSVPGL